MWVNFHTMRTSELPSLWSTILRDVRCEESDIALLAQLVNLELFESVVLQTAQPVAKEVLIRPLTLHEVCYAAGYALKKKLNCRPQFERCFSCLAVAGKNPATLTTPRSGWSW